MESQQLRTRSRLEPITGELDAILASFVADRLVAGAAAGVVVDQSLTWANGSGFADLESGRRADHRTVYAIGSISKTFTASSVMQLRDEGALQLDDPFVRHVPEFAAITDPFGPIEMITVRHLLQHSSGLQAEYPSQGNPRTETFVTTDELLGMLEQVRIAIAPGSAFKYSNVGFRLLGELVHRLSGQRLHDRIRAEILVPLGMDSTTDHPGDVAPDRLATGYDRRRFDDRLPTARVMDPAHLEGEGDIWSSVEDMALWVAQQLRLDEGLAAGPGQILAGSTIAEMHRPTFAGDSSVSSAQGLGWHMWRRGETVAMGHNGAVFGFSAHVSFDPVDRLGAIVLVNGGGCTGHVELAASMIEITRPHARDVLTDQRAIELAPRAVPEDWHDLLGAYRWAEFDLEFRVEVRDGELVSIMDGETTRLAPTDEPLRFRLAEGREAGEDLLFYSSASGTVEGLNFAGWPCQKIEPAPDH